MSARIGDRHRKFRDLGLENSVIQAQKFRDPGPENSLIPSVRPYLYVHLYMCVCMVLLVVVRRVVMVLSVNFSANGFARESRLLMSNT